MKTSFSINTPDNVLATVTISAPIDEFRRLSKMLGESEHRFHWPLAGLYKGVQRVIDDAEKHFTHQETKEID